MFIVAAGGLADKVGRKKIDVYWVYFKYYRFPLFIVLAQGAALLIIGRIIQGISAACIMPSTIALMKAYFEGADRQRALSFWSIGSWGGSGVCSFAGGAIATYMGWRWIFIFLDYLCYSWDVFLLKIRQKVKQESTGNFKFDYTGLVIFIITMLALNVFHYLRSRLGLDKY